MGKSPTEAKQKPKTEVKSKTTLLITSYVKANGANGLKKQFVKDEK